jgi:hypothetical protein
MTPRRPTAMPSQATAGKPGNTALLNHRGTKEEKLGEPDLRARTRPITGTAAAVFKAAVLIRSLEPMR